MSEKESRTTLQNILTNLPPSNKPKAHLHPSILKKCLEKLRILQTKLGSTTRLGKQDHLPSRAAICLEHVIRRDFGGVSDRIEISNLARCVNMTDKQLRDVKEKMDHYIDDPQRHHSSTNPTILEEPRTNDLLQQLAIKLSIHDDLDIPTCFRNTKVLLQDIHQHILHEKTESLRHASLTDFERKQESYIAACFGIGCLESFHFSTRKEWNDMERQLLPDIILAAKLTNTDFGKVYSHVLDLESMISKQPRRNGVMLSKRKREQKLVSERMYPRPTMKNDQQSSKPAKEKGRLTVDEILGKSKNDHAFDSQFSKQEDATRNDIPSIKTESSRTKCHLLPLRYSSDITHPKLSKEFLIWKRDILMTATNDLKDGDEMC